MSVVVAVKTKDGFILGADKKCVCGNKVTKTTKVYAFNDCPGAVIGGVGYATEIQGVSYIPDIIPECNRFKDDVDERLIYENVYPRMLKYLRDYERIKKDEKMGSNYILAFNKQAWFIGMDGYVYEIKDYCATGSGEDAAIGSLASTKDQQPKDRIKSAIKAAADNTLYVGEGYDILQTYQIGGNI